MSVRSKNCGTSSQVPKNTNFSRRVARIPRVERSRKYCILNTGQMSVGSTFYGTFLPTANDARNIFVFGLFVIIVAG